jgi:predicted RNA-binding protein YlqC (UPF0109 family)
MAERDQEFLEYIVGAIVDKPEAVKINRTVDERGVLLELSVDPEDMGKVIGKAGGTAKAIRTLLRVNHRTGRRAQNGIRGTVGGSRVNSRAGSNRGRIKRGGYQVQSPRRPRRPRRRHLDLTLKLN